MIINQGNQAQNPQNPIDDPNAPVGRTDQGTGFVDPNAIMNANTGAGARMGTTIGQGLTGAASGLLNQGQQSLNTFGTSLGQAYDPYSNSQGTGIFNQGNQFLGKEQSAIGGNYGVNSGGGAFTGGEQNTANLGTQIQNASANYNGPTNLANAQNLQNQAATVGALGQLAGTQAGQGQLLKSYVAKGGNYTSGDAALDQMLLGAGGQNQLQQGANYLNQNIPSKINNDIALAQQQGQAQKTGIGGQSQQIMQQALNEMYGSSPNAPTAQSLEGVANAHTAQEQAYIAQIQNALQSAANYGTGGTGVATGPGTFDATQIPSQLNNWGLNTTGQMNSANTMSLNQGNSSQAIGADSGSQTNNLTLQDINAGLGAASQNMNGKLGVTDIHGNVIGGEQNALASMANFIPGQKALYNQIHNGTNLTTQQLGQTGLLNNAKYGTTQTNTNVGNQEQQSKTNEANQQAWLNPAQQALQSMASSGQINNSTQGLPGDMHIYGPNGEQINPYMTKQWTQPDWIPGAVGGLLTGGVAGEIIGGTQLPSDQIDPNSIRYSIGGNPYGLTTGVYDTGTTQGILNNSLNATSANVNDVNKGNTNLNNWLNSMFNPSAVTAGSLPPGHGPGPQINGHNGPYNVI